jgi:hypothetical protein
MCVRGIVFTSVSVLKNMCWNNSEDVVFLFSFVIDIIISCGLITSIIPRWSVVLFKEYLYMVNMLFLRFVDRGFEPRSGKIKDMFIELYSFEII